MDLGNENHNSASGELEALGHIKKGMEKYIQTIPGNIEIRDLQKIALLGTSHILRNCQLIG